MPLVQTYSFLENKQNDPVAISNTVRSGIISLDDGTQTPCISIDLPEQTKLVYSLKEVQDMVKIMNQFLINVHNTKQANKPINIVKRAKGSKSE